MSDIKYALFESERDESFRFEFVSVMGGMSVHVLCIVSRQRMQQICAVEFSLRHGVPLASASFHAMNWGTLVMTGHGMQLRHHRVHETAILVRRKEWACM